MAIYHSKCHYREDLKSQNIKKDQTQSSSDWILHSRGIVNSDYKWGVGGVSALYKFSKSSPALGGIVYGLHDYVSNPLTQRRGSLCMTKSFSGSK